MADYPDSYKYSAEHEWVALDGEIGTIGITDHAQAELGDVVFVELPEVGSTFDQNAVFGTIESVKAVSDLYAPISGEVVEVNDDLVDRPETVNEDPHEAAWMVKVKLSDASQLDGLMDVSTYQGSIQE
ncbi:MAG: glycine cleavage system protein GcvH [Acidobacteria bacterium]|nr:glycine cleavage system protein GcvH [Acidobacteriota bacterium]